MGLFTRKQDKGPQASPEPTESEKAPVATAREIQLELLEQEDALAKAAVDQLMQELTEDRKVQRLRELGFIKTKEVTEDARKQEAYRKAELAQLMRKKAAEEYPGLKYIAESAMERVCRKYGLVLGPVKCYTGEVPDWAIDQIARVNDLVKTWEVHVQCYPDGNTSCSDKNGNVLPSMTGEQFIALKQHKDVEVKLANSLHAADNLLYDLSDHYILKTANRELAESFGMAANAPRLLIAAPEKEMDDSAVTLRKVGWQIHEMERYASTPGWNPRSQIWTDPSGTRTVEVLDPIVCFAAHGGFIVLAAWGEEGQDPEVFNQGLN